MLDEQLANVRDDCERVAVPVRGGQETHATDAEELAYVPEPQSEHCTEPLPSAKDPGGQPVHSPGPGASLDVPGSHATHGP
eukprot:3596134-Rhodomonas_salina.1